MRSTNRRLEVPKAALYSDLPCIYKELRPLLVGALRAANIIHVEAMTSYVIIEW